MSNSQQSYNKAVIVQTPPSVGNEEVLFDAKQFNDFIYKHGYVCYIERRLYCPCISYNTGQPLTDCLNCGGTGRFYINKQESIIACQGISNVNKYESWSITNQGIVTITAQPKDKMGFEDRVTLPELEMWFSEVLQMRKSNDSTTVFAFTKYTPLKIFYAYYFAGPNTPLVYIDPSLITIQNNKIIFQSSTFASLYPVNVTICYVTNPQYLILDINRDLVKTIARPSCNAQTDLTNKTNLPLKYVGKLLHLLPDAPNFNNLGLFDNTNYSATPPNYDDGSNQIVINIAPPGAGQPKAPYPFTTTISGTGPFNIQSTQHMIPIVKGVLLLNSSGNVVNTDFTIDPLTQNVQILTGISLTNYKLIIY